MLYCIVDSKDCVKRLKNKAIHVVTKINSLYTCICVCAFSNMEDFFEKFPTSKNVNDFPRVNRAYISF